MSVPISGERSLSTAKTAILAMGLMIALLSLPRPAAAAVTVSVKDTGAVGNGIADDTGAFQSALALFDPTGGTLLIPPGVYLLRPSTIVIPSNISVVATQATVKAGWLGFSLFDVQGDSISVSGLTVDGNNKAVRGMTVVAGSTNVLVSNTTFQNFTQPSDLTSDLYFQVPVGVRVEGNGDSITFDGISVRNVIARNTNGPGWPHKVARGIWIAPGSGQTISTNVTLTRSQFFEVGPKDDGDCVVIQDSTDNAGLQVIGNTFDRCHKRAIKIQVPGATVANNTINNPFLNDNKYDTYPETNTYDMYSAVSVYASNVTVSGNTISGVGSFYNGIDIDAGGPLSTISVQNNSVRMGPTATITAPSSSIRALVPVTSLTITNNFLDRATWGIRLDGSTTLSTVSNNVILHTTTAISCGTSCAGTVLPMPQIVGVPSYFYPGPQWAQMESGAPTAGMSIINPNSGPGPTQNPDYVSQVQEAQLAGLLVFGYVDTAYGARSPAAVQADVDSYFAWYGVDGIFLDRVPTDCAHQPYYASLWSYVNGRSATALTVLNPGTQTSECYMSASDIIVTFENTVDSYRNSYTSPGWVAAYDPSRFWHLIYGAPASADMQSAVRLSKERGAGVVYVSPYTLAQNPWGAMPATQYWNDELSAVSAPATPAGAAVRTAATTGNSIAVKNAGAARSTPSRKLPAPAQTRGNGH